MNDTINTVGQVVALLSFVIGTTFLSLHLYFPNVTEILMSAMVFIVIAIVVNIIIFIALLITIATKGSNRFAHLKVCGLMLLNIPIAILYMYIVVTFPSLARL